MSAAPAISRPKRPPASFDPSSALVIVMGTPEVIMSQSDSMPRDRGFTVMPATELAGVSGAEFDRQVSLGLRDLEDVWPGPGARFPNAKVRGDVAAVFQYGTPEQADAVLAKISSGPGAKYGFMIEPHGDAAAMQAVIDHLWASKGRVQMRDATVLPLGSDDPKVPARIDLMVSRSDLKAVIDAQASLSQSRANYDVASLVSPVAGAIHHLAGSVRLDEWRKGPKGFERTGAVLEGFAAIHRLHDEFGAGAYRKISLDGRSAVISASYSPDPARAKATLDAAVGLSDMRRREADALRSRGAAISAAAAKASQGVG